MKKIEIIDCDRVASLKGKTIKFDCHLNFIVGENGSGKSTILRALANESSGLKFTHSIVGKKGKLKTLKTYFFDSEKMNPRTRSYCESGADILSRFVSHGECLLNCIEMIKQVPGGNTHLVLIDEPENGISPWNQCKLRDLFLEDQNSVN